MGLYSLGPFYPATAESVSESPFSGRPWVTPAQVSADDNRCATITDTSFDAAVRSTVLKAYNFPGLTGVPDTATILGVQSEYQGNWVAGAQPAVISLAQLLTNQRVKGGTNQYATTEDMSAAMTIHSKGGYGDLWGNALSAAWIRHSGFGVAYGVSAESNNTDISADFVRLTVWYSTPDSYTFANEDGCLVITPDNDNAFTSGASQEYEPEVEGAAFIGYGGVSTVYFATELDVGAPAHDYAVASVYSASLLSATDYPYVADVWGDFSAESNLGANFSPAIGVNEELAAGSILGIGIGVLGDIAGQFSVGAVVSSTTAASYSPDAGVAEELAADSVLKVARFPEAGATSTVYVESGVSANITGAGNIEVGTAAWGLAGGVSTVYFATQRDAGVPVHNFESAAAIIPPMQDRFIEGSVAETFSVGDNVLLPLVQANPLLEGSVAEELWCSSVLDIYATPVYSDYKIDGSVAWAVAEPVTEYWIDIAADRGFPQHNFIAGADYFSGAKTIFTHAGLAEAVFVAGADNNRNLNPIVGAVEILAAASNTLGITSQQNALVGTATAIFAAAGERVQTVVTDGTAAAEIAASCAEVPPYPQRTIEITGDVAALFSQGGIYSVSSPTAYAVVGDVAFFSESLAEKAVANLYDALAEYGIYSGTLGISTPYPGYSEIYPSEAVPGGLFTDETKPLDGYAMEPEPTLPAGQDGVWTMEPNDGGVTEPPEQGAYTLIGHFKEWKPWYQPHARTNAPAKRSATRENKPS